MINGRSLFIILFQSRGSIITGLNCIFLPEYQHFISFGVVYITHVINLCLIKQEVLNKIFDKISYTFLITISITQKIYLKLSVEDLYKNRKTNRCVVSKTANHVCCEGKIIIAPFRLTGLNK